MKDVRLLHNPEYYSNRTNWMEKTRMRLAELPGRQHFQRGVCEWWRECSVIVIEKTSGLDNAELHYKTIDSITSELPSISEKIQTVLSTVGQETTQNFIYAFDKVIGRTKDGIKTNEYDDEIALLIIGTEVGKEIAKSNSPVQLQYFHKMAENHNEYNLIEYFKDSFLGTCLERPDLKAFWIPMLAAPPDLSECIDRFERELSPEMVEKEAEVWKSCIHPFAIWSRKNLFDVPAGFHYVRYTLLRRLDINEWRLLYETLPLPDIQKYVLYNTEIGEDPSAILDELKAAGIAFDESGNWNRNLLAIATSQYVITYAVRLFESLDRNQRVRPVREYVENPAEDDEQKEKLRVEMGRWYSQAFNLLLGRVDGMVIGLELYADLFNRILIEQDKFNGEDRSKVLTQAYEELEKALKEKGVRTEQIRSIGERHQVWESSLGAFGQYYRASGLHFALAAASMADKGDDSGLLDEEDAIELWEWLKKLLEEKDHYISTLMQESHPKSRNIVEYMLGRMLLSLRVPSSELQHVWNALHKQRIKSIHYREAHLGEEDPSKLLIGIGLGATAHFIEKNLCGKYEETIKLWAFILEKIQLMYLTQRFEVSRRWKDMYVFAILHLGVYFKEGHYLLDRSVKFLSNNTQLHRDVAQPLKRNGWSEEAIMSLLLRNCIVDSNLNYFETPPEK